jgi:hypothetical protein
LRSADSIESSPQGSMSADGKAPEESMGKRAIEKIMKLVTSLLGLEQNQRRLEKKVRTP